MVAELSKRVEHQDMQERLAAQAAIVAELLAERDERLLETLRQARASARVVELAERYLAGDRQERQAAMGARAVAVALAAGPCPAPPPEQPPAR